MKAIRFSFFFLGFFVLSFGLQAQIAFVNGESIVQAMPEYRSAKSELEAFGKQLEKSIQQQEEKFMTEYQKTMKAAQEGQLSPVQQKQAEEKLAKMQEELEKSRQKAQQDIMAKEQELTKPMYDKFNEALKKVAQENKYAYIVDEKLLLYSGGGIDATPKIKAALGIQ
jgi:outer membrane protein